MKRTLSLLALAGLVVSPAAQAQDADVFQPSSVWAADYGDDYCRLVRTFSDGRDEVTLMLQRIQPGADTQLLLIGNGTRAFRGANELQWHFLPDGANRKSLYTRSETANGQQVFRIEGVMLTPPAPPAPGAAFSMPPPYDRTAEQAAGRAITGLALTGGVTKPARIETGRLGDVIAALQTCTDDLIKTWGVDADKHKVLSVPAFPLIGPDGWLPTGTIPFGDFAKLGAGGNQVRLMLGADGKPTACHIHSPTLGEALNARICRLLMEKATFSPAKDAAGEAMASYWLGSPLFLGPPFPGGGRPGG